MNETKKNKTWKVPQTYATIPAVVRFSKKVSGNAKLLYGDIVLMSHLNGYCNASNDYFAFIYGVDDKTISEWVKQLKDSGFIRCPIMKRANERHIYPQIGKMREYDLSQDNTTPESGKDDLVESGKPDNNITSINTNISNEIFSPREYVNNLIKGKDRKVTIISIYILKKKLFDDTYSKKQINAIVYNPRLLAVAKRMVDFTDSQILAAMNKCENMEIRGQKVDWKLETVETQLLK